jgi:tetratricopeptide (TPR) repeat protein
MKWKVDMNRILFRVFLFLFVTFCMTPSVLAEKSISYYNKGFSAQGKSNYDEAIKFFTVAIESGDISADYLLLSYFGRGVCRVGKGDYDNSLTDWNVVIELNPKEANAFFYRGFCWGKKREYDRAIVDFNRAIELYPTHAMAFFYRGLSWGDKEDYDRAIADGTKAIELNPNFAPAYVLLATALSKRGEYNKVILNSKKAIELNPNFAPAYCALAWLFSTCPDSKYRDGMKAVELAKKAVELTEASFTLFPLAAAYAEVDRFQDAIKTQDRAIKKFNEENNAKDLVEAEEQLASYKAGKPWRAK